MAQQSESAVSINVAAHAVKKRGDDILVIDNAVSDPFALRTKALQAPFTDLEMPGDGVYPRSCIVDIPEFVEEVERTVGRKLSTVGTGFRLCFGGEVPQQFVHHDMAYGTLSAVLYLTLPDNCLGGTAFWTHKPAEGQIEVDWNNPAEWEQTSLVEMKFNRLVIYPSNKIHSRWPQEAFGTGPENGRLTAVGFFNEKKVEFRQYEPIKEITSEDIKLGKLGDEASSSPIIVRPAVLDPLDDVEFVLKSGKKFYLESGLQKLGTFNYMSLAKSVRDMIKVGQAIVLIAEKDGQRVGGISASYCPLFFNHERGVFQEQWWWVDPIHRGHGFGKMLLKALEAEAEKRNGSIVVMMHLPKDSKGSQYKKEGYFLGETLYYKVLK